MHAFFLSFVPGRTLGKELGDVLSTPALATAFPWTGHIIHLGFNISVCKTCKLILDVL